MMTPKRRLILALFGLIALVFAAYWPAFSAGFIYLDDPTHVLNNPVVNGGVSWEAVMRAFRPYASLWTPLTWISHLLVVNFAGLDPWWHHFVNVALHAFSVVLLFWWLLRVTERFLVSLAVATLFAVHPLNVENVVWVTERNHLLAMVFLLGAMHAYTSHVACVSVRDSRRASGWMRLTELGMLLSIMSKGTFVIFPVLLLILDAWPFQRVQRKNVWRLVSEKIGLFAIGIFSMCMTFAALAPEASAGGTLSVASRVCVALTTLGWQAVRIAVPYVLSPIHSQPRELLWMEALVSAAGLILAAYVGWRLRKRAPWILVGLAWYTIALAPLSGITQAGNTFFSDRFVYLPQVGIFLAASYCLAALCSRMRHGVPIGLVFLALVTVVYGATTHWYARQWKDTATLFTHATSVTKNNFIAHTTAARALIRQGDLPGAVSHFEAGLRINPGAVNFRNYYGQTLASLERYDEAAWQFNDVMARDPAQARTRFNLAAIQLKLGRPAEALANLRMLKNQQFTDPNLDQLIEKAAAQASGGQPANDGFPKGSNAKP
jgi:hypothetical protein